MKFISDKEINKTRKIVVGKLRSETRKWSHLFCDLRDYEAWLISAVYEGITIALRTEDKRDRTKGDFVYWSYLKTRKAAWRDLEREKQHAELVSVLKKEPVSMSHDPFASSLFSGAKLDGISKELTRDQMQAIACIYLVGYSPDETASILKRKRNAVDGLVHRAKQKAREVYRRNTTVARVVSKVAESHSEQHLGVYKPRSSLTPNSEEPDVPKSEFQRAE